jgi:hypothetical protein
MIDMDKLGPRPELLRCGCAPSGYGGCGDDVGWTCWLHPLDTVPMKESEILSFKKTIESRQASCSCGLKKKSDPALPFFNIRLGQETDSFYCGCKGWE